jgi:hypothetical protein
MDTRGALWPASAAAFGLAASSYITIDSYHGYRTPTASGPDYGSRIPKQKRSDCGSIYRVGRNRPRAICVRPTMRRVQARIRRERFGHLSTLLPGMSGRQARAALLNSREATRPPLPSASTSNPTPYPFWLGPQETYQPLRNLKKLSFPRGR